ncbi:Barstar (barnase inhibitor) [Amycolatopsis lurida]|uniref:barstar family protein n=1 Tax=Amycolatopsis lurida TaxID=31959 RepID=UPI000898FF42|nr:barstar family protein [Amycolatopsis lurida]SEB32562.1 Barstar (barnase inhibitor) [Amycolatopsis lurida]
MAARANDSITAIGPAAATPADSVVGVVVNPNAGLRPEQQRWTWEHPAGPRWLLCGDIGFDDSYDDVPLALCAEIEGLFVDLPPRSREQFTFVGCAPVGVLADLLDRLAAEALGTERAWLGNVSLTAPTPPSWGEDLCDVVVLAQRPNATTPETVDIDLDGFVYVNDRTDAVARPGGVDEFVVQGWDGTPYGVCEDVTGVFREQAAAPVPQVRLLGCRPEPPLLAALDALGQSPKASRRRRWLRGDVHMVAIDGSAGRVIDAVVSGTVSAAAPSRLGAGLLDVSIDVVSGEPLPAGVLDILDQRRAGRPSRRNLWAAYSRELRHQWAKVALGHHSSAPDPPSGTTYDLDGRFVTDIEGFYCAIGEAINGPGGYFGWNLDALDDCLSGGFGALPPFRLVWHDSAVARAHLVAGYDRHRLRPATTLEDLLTILAEHGIEVDLR